MHVICCLESMSMPVLIKKMHHKPFFGPAAICLDTSYFCTDKFSFVPNCSNCIQIAWEEAFLAYDSIKLCLGIVSESAGWLVQHYFRGHAKKFNSMNDPMSMCQSVHWPWEHMYSILFSICQWFYMRLCQEQWKQKAWQDWNQE